MVRMHSYSLLVIIIVFYMMNYQTKWSTLIGGRKSTILKSQRHSQLEDNISYNPYLHGNSKLNLKLRLILEMALKWMVHLHEAFSSFHRDGYHFCYRLVMTSRPVFHDHSDPKWKLEIKIHLWYGIKIKRYIFARYRHRFIVIWVSIFSQWMITSRPVLFLMTYLRIDP